MESVVNKYFVDLLKSNGSRDLEHCFVGWSNILFEVQISRLNRTFHRSEIETVMGQMHPNKAPGPDGFSPGFFQIFWEIVGDDVSVSILKFLNCRGSIEDFNETFICLIPKVQNALAMKNFRPISLCSTMYKIVSKILANRLKSVLSGLISHNQSVFIPNRLITDNVIVAFELLHSFRQRRGKRDGYYA